MLGYLDALIAALSVRDGAEAARLLAHPLARLLPEDVIGEAAGFAQGERDALAAPLRAMQLRYRTAELLRDADQQADHAELVEPLPRPSIPPAMHARRASRPQQMELPLSA